MKNQKKEIAGAWTQAAGTIIAAIGTSEWLVLDDSAAEALIIIGNELQAAGSALEADGQDRPSLEKIGNELQAAGNLSVIAGLVLDPGEESELKLVITGNLIQALGSLTVLGDELNDPTAEGRTFQIIGSFLQAIGNSLQAFGTLLFLSTFLTHPDAAVRNDGKSLDISGSWIQAAGSVLSALGQTQEELSEISSKGEQEFKGFALLNKQHKYN
ncbi:MULTISPECIES: DUF6944 family repetitive protein [Bacillaceae]|uniref:DUF6944 family repetitive protein n=1 Tax=Bacillaceae TaxID=186817 RepID=UPI002964AFDB|nr:hypothetical protein [Bacillus infantis]MDW2880025.1 hypothetical protein [Bacillus infantis]